MIQLYNAYKKHTLYSKTQIESKIWKKGHHTNSNQNRAGGAILISDNINFTTNVYIRVKEGHFIMKKGSIHQEEMTAIKIYLPNRAPKYMKQNWTELKGEIENLT